MALNSNPRVNVSEGSTIPAPRSSKKQVNKYEITTFEDADKYVPLSSYIISRGLSVFADIILDIDDRSQRRVNLNEGDSKDHIVSMSITNEKGKHPQVDFETIVPNFRSTKNEHNRLEDYKIGRSLFVEFGYGTALTRQGPFVIDSKEVAYDKGTAILRVTAKMGRKLSTVTTADVFTSSAGKGVIDKLAALAGYTVDYTDVLKEEKNELKKYPRSPAGNTNVGHKALKIATEEGLDFYIDTELNVIKLSTPYKLDLVKKGKKPLKIQYGFPSSNIKSLSVKETRKKTKTTGSGSDQNLNLNQALGGVITNSGTHYVPHGVTIPSSKGAIYIGIPLEERTFSDDDVNKRNGQTAIQKAQKRFPPSGFQLEEDQFSRLGVNKIFNVFKKKRASNLVLDSSITSLPEKEIESLLNDNSVIVLINGQPSFIGGDAYFPVQVFTKQSTSNENKPKDATKRTTIVNSTTTEVIDDPRAEYAYVWRRHKNTKKVAILDDEDKATEQSKGERSRALAKLRDLAKDSTLRLAEIKRENSTVYFLQERVKAKVVNIKKPKTVKKDKDQQVVNPSSADDQNRSQKGPKGAGVSNNGIQSYLSTKELTVQLTTGDFFMNVGTLIEIVDMNESLNGVYSIKSCKHDVTVEGFHTSFVCVSGYSKSNFKNIRKEDKRSTRKNGNKLQVSVTEAPEKAEYTYKKKPSTRKNYHSNRLK